LDRIEQKDLAYHQRVREGFLKLAEREERIMVIDATQEIDVIHRVVLHAVGKLLAAKRITPKASFTEAD
jgi:dTMP kinase